jgi:hypothetical protein
MEHGRLVPTATAATATPAPSTATIAGSMSAAVSAVSATISAAAATVAIPPVSIALPALAVPSMLAVVTAAYFFGPKWHSLRSCHLRAQKSLDF